MESGVNDWVSELADQLQCDQLTLATAESCTGGWLGRELTALAGSSAWYSGGVISYSNSAKVCLLKVPEATLAEYGAVSEPVARAMVRGAQEALQADCSVSITGVAGPGGGSLEKPVGTVWIAWRLHEYEEARSFLFYGDREAVRLQAVEEALQGLLKMLKK